MERDREATVQSPGLPGFPTSPGFHLQSPFQPRRHEGSVRPSAHPTHLSNGPDVPGPDDTRLQTGALAGTKSCSAARGSLFVLCLAVAANSRSHGPDGWRGVRAARTGRQLGLKQWPVKCQKWQGRAVVEQRGDHGRMAPGALETISVGSHRPLWQS